MVAIASPTDFVTRPPLWLAQLSVLQEETRRKHQVRQGLVLIPVPVEARFVGNWKSYLSEAISKTGYKGGVSPVAERKNNTDQFETSDKLRFCEVCIL